MSSSGAAWSDRKSGAYGTLLPHLSSPKGSRGHRFIELKRTIMTQPTGRQHRRDVLLAVAGILACLLGCGSALLSVRILRPEDVFVFNAAIDTRYAAGYSESAFVTIAAGMRADEVVAILGEPLHRDADMNGGKVWHYSEDGALSGWDFAWLVRAVRVDRTGKVLGVVSDVRYD